MGKNTFNFNKVRPKKYSDKSFREVFGSELGKATPDDFLAAWIWTKEGYYVREMWTKLHSHMKRVRRELEEAQKRREAVHGDMPERVAMACRTAARSLAAALAEEEAEATEAQDECATVWKEMSEQFGLPMTQVYRGDRRQAASGSTAFESVMPLWHQYLEAEERLEELLTQDREELHKIALIDARRMAFIHSEAGISLEEIAKLHHAEFEQLTVDLLIRDGYEIVRSKGGAGDLGADVIARGPKGETVVVQCKHRANSTKIGSPDLQRLNGTAKQVHGADIVVAMTNGTFSKPAQRFAEDQNICLIEARELEQWATWGQPLSELLLTGEVAPRDDG
ncbi:restriction endonuclease [Streptomyces sp. bgisy126]|uniref:restriction endonuclease n=1 Tax=unclassified Streptomyces TaxID=2593676 RepID=UPI003EBAEB25